MKRKACITCLMLFFAVISTAFAQTDEKEFICFKGECWQEQGLTRLAGKGCPTPTLFVITGLAELKSYVNGAKKFGLTPQQVKKLTDIYEHANMLVIKERGNLQSSTVMLVTELTKDLPEQKKIDKLIGEIEDYCWGTVSELAKDVHAARSIVK